VFGHEAGRRALALAEQSLPTFPEKKIEPVRSKDTFPLDVSDVRASLRSLTARAAGILRDGETMRNAVQMLDFWQNYVYAEEFQTVAGLELQNMILCAQLVLRAAIRREESRGAHQRSDFPKTDDTQWKKHVELNRADFG
jgi:succinate dehydrogenase/fumarate reductase flavoprotein subunit